MKVVDNSSQHAGVRQQLQCLSGERAKYLKILEAQLAVGDPKKHPEFAGTVRSVDTREFWRNVEASPANQGYHYNRNAETYLLVGDALGRVMVELRTHPKK